MSRELTADDLADIQVADLVKTIVGGDGSAKDKIKELRELHEKFVVEVGDKYLDKDKKQIRDAIAKLKLETGLIYKYLPHLATSIKKGGGKKTRKKRRRKKKKKRRKTRRKRKKKKRKTRSRRR